MRGNNMNHNLTLTNIESELTNVLAEIQDAYYDIPFDNTAFQTENFVIAAQITPQRAYRSIGLQMLSKINALMQNQASDELQDIRVDEINWKLQNEEMTEFDRRRLQVELKTISSNRVWSKKLKNDSIQDLNLLYKHFKSLPKYTRSQFESAEKEYFEQSLHRQVQQITGATESLINMSEDVKALKDFETALKEIPVEKLEDSALLPSLEALYMKNKIKINRDMEIKHDN